MVMVFIYFYIVQVIILINFYNVLVGYFFMGLLMLDIFYFLYLLENYFEELLMIEVGILGIRGFVFIVGRNYTFFFMIGNDNLCGIDDRYWWVG
jgi:hypothetical protein